MKLAQDMGFAVQGYEVDPVAAEAVQSSTGIRVFSGDIFEIDFQRNTYDCVYLDQVLEHPKNPARYLHLVHDLLAGGGIAYIGVPNIGSLSNKLKTTRGRLGLRARSRIGKHYDTWQHLHYFRPSCFQRVLKRLFHLDPINYAGDPFPRGIRLMRNLRSAFPLLESSMIVLARKTPA
jgi:SAM-dependent methyltransferase